MKYDKNIKSYVYLYLSQITLCLLKNIFKEYFCHM
jgi:hypothetical protein